MTKRSLFVLGVYLLRSVLHAYADPLDLTSTNRRPPISGLPDWSKAGFEQGARALPTDADVSLTIGADQLIAAGVIPDDGQDDTAALQEVLDTMVPYGSGTYTLVVLPAGVINLSATIWLEKPWMILRGSGNFDTQIVFSPSATTKYDVLTDNGAEWDIDGMEFSWTYSTGDGGSGLGGGGSTESGTATSGWIWPGRSMFRIGSQAVAEKFAIPYSMAPDNRKDFFKGTVNYHWRNDKGTVKGFMALQTMDKPGLQGTNKVYVDPSTPWDVWAAAKDVWIASPVKYNDYHEWGVTTDSYYVNAYVFQDWATVTNVANDTTGTYLELDHNLRFDVYSNSIADGSPVMDNAVSYAKIMPIDVPADHIGIENLYLTQPMPQFTVADAKDNYGNMDPASAMHGIVFRYAKDCWVRNVQTYMTGSHPIATEAARNIQVQDNIFDGAWNKGAGGNGYVRGSRVWDSLYYNNTLRDLRHFTFQWCAMGNVAILNNVTNDFNMHGGYEGHNLIELNYASVSYAHRAGSCTANCGGEGGDQSEAGTWWPIYWSTGEKASKWSGATGPQNVFYRNYMIKQATAGADFEEYQPYFAKDGSLSEYIWQFGWDADTEYGDSYQHLTLDDNTLIGPGVLVDWQGNEQFDYTQTPRAGVNGRRTDQYTSLFLRDVTALDDGITTYNSIAGYAYCRGSFTPKIVGYYLSTSETSQCQPWPIQNIDYTAYTHLLFAFAQLGSDGTLSLTGSQPDQLTRFAALKSNESGLKVFLAVGGWGLGADATHIRAVAGSGSYRTKLANSALALCKQYNLDGIDLEWATGISAAQFTTIATTIKTALGTSYSLSLSTPHDFWYLSGLNVVTIPLAAAVEFVSLITHNDTSPVILSPNAADNIAIDLEAIQKAGFPPNMVLAGVPFYGRSRVVDPSCGNRGCQVLSKGYGDSCIVNGNFGGNIVPYYGLELYQDGDTLTSDPVYTAADWINPGSNSRILLLSDGSYLEYDDPSSVTFKANSIIQLCMGGLSVFSIDMDNVQLDLTYAMWDVGGLIPAAPDIAISIINANNPLTDDGFISIDFWDSAANYISTKYAWLSMEGTYKILAEVAMNVQLAIVQRLKNLVYNSALSQDNFALYQKWETKSTNWMIANATGYGNQYWSCATKSNAADSDYSSSNCPGGFEQDSTGNPDVYWRLDDYNGFQTYLNNSIGITLDDLIVGDIAVNMSPEYCIVIPDRRSLARHRRTHTSFSHINPWSAKNVSHWTHNGNYTDDGTGHIRNLYLKHPFSNATHIHPNSTTRFTRNHPVNHGRRDAPDPYDPDPSCEMTWHNILLVNSTAWFQPPQNALDSYFAIAQATTNIGQQYTGIGSTSQGQLIQILQSFMNSIAIGNGTIASTLSYISEVQYDRDLQAEFDQATARESALQIFLDIGLTLLGFIPGIGDLALIDRGVEAIEAVSGLAKSARLSRLLSTEDKLGNLFADGIKGADEVAEAAAESEDVLTPETFEARGKVGEKVEENNVKVKSCSRQKDGDLFMAALDQGSSLIPPPDDPSNVVLGRRRPINWKHLIHIRDSKRSFALSRALSSFSRKDTGRASNTYPLNQDLVPVHPPRSNDRPLENKSRSESLTKWDIREDLVYPGLWKRAQGGDCIFTMTTANSLKGKDKDGNYYTAGCVGIAFDYMSAAGDWETGDLEACRTANPGSSACQCDHIFEADEALQTWQDLAGISKQVLSGNGPTATAAFNKGKALCDELPGLTDAIKKRLNDPSNVKPLYQALNTAKYNWITPSHVNSAGRITSSSSHDIEYVTRLGPYMSDNSPARTATAQGMDTDADELIEDAGLEDDPFWKTSYKQGNMDATRAAGDASFDKKITWSLDEHWGTDPVANVGSSSVHSSPSQADPSTCGGKKDAMDVDSD